MNQESSRNPKHRPAAEKAGKPRAGGTPPKRSSGSRATAASHGKSPAKKPTAARPTGTQNRNPAAKKPPANPILSVLSNKKCNSCLYPAKHDITDITNNRNSLRTGI